ncbi:helix-turn-helix domain-containing protein, partial [Bacillus cereus]|nr:helix-turn-helix domain-containing protein [Bacillus cereus]MCU5556868.1 helix-turn-helix domain-containing protein [Bacillus cereus]
MFFGDKLKKEREKKGWSQEYLATKIHVSRQSV